VSDETAIPEVTQDEVIGQDFLTWLWYCSDTGHTFTDSEGNPFSVVMDRRVVVEICNDSSKETASASGSQSPLREARYGLVKGKKVTSAVLCLVQDEAEYLVTLKASDFCMGSLRTPKVELDDDGNDPDATFLQKHYLIGVAVGLIDAVYAEFLKLRISDEWQAETGAIAKWVAKP
jgi:hypothetical protein